jgi:hypothetical protein
MHVSSYSSIELGNRNIQWSLCSFFVNKKEKTMYLIEEEYFGFVNDNLASNPTDHKIKGAARVGAAGPTHSCPLNPQWTYNKNEQTSKNL